MMQNWFRARKLPEVMTKQRIRFARPALQSLHRAIAIALRLPNTTGIDVPSGRGA